MVVVSNEGQSGYGTTSSIYRDLGIVMELSYGDMSSRYDGNFVNHYHITCGLWRSDYHRDLVDGIEERAERIPVLRMSFIGWNSLSVSDCQTEKKGAN